MILKKYKNICIDVFAFLIDNERYFYKDTKLIHLKIRLATSTVSFRISFRNSNAGYLIGYFQHLESNRSCNLILCLYSMHIFGRENLISDPPVLIKHIHGDNAQ